MVENTVIDYKKDSQSFDSVAGLYDQYRPEYPKELVDSLIALSRIPDAGRILEIGSGTGKATRLFASRGYSIHCIEPGGNLAALASHNLHEFSGVTIEQARFEDWQESSECYDLVISAQAFHWVEKEIGYAKAARILKPTGYLALFWNMYQKFDGEIDGKLENIYRTIVPEWSDRPKKDNEEIIIERSNDISGSGFFGPVIIQRFPWNRVCTTGAYLGLLNTYSDHLRLTDDTRQRLFAAIGEAIDTLGGFIKINYLSVLYLAKKYF
jgi:SAM-dependent methyltransferase